MIIQIVDSYRYFIDWLPVTSYRRRVNFFEYLYGIARSSSN